VVTVPRVTTLPTADLDAERRSAARSLMDAAYDEFSEQDWAHALGGVHVLVEDGGVLVAHGSVVPRRLMTAGVWLRAGYVEAVAVHPDHRRQGHGHTVMAELERLGPMYDVLALSSSEAGLPLYESRGWQRWRGPTSVVSQRGVERTPEDDDSVYVLRADGLDLDRELVCEWRAGDVW
jgi:aminoglycoside 2'-N-acetyltransferase I